MNSLRGKLLKEIGPDDIRDLIGVRENEYLEFKSEFSKEGKGGEKFCKEFTAFANTYGGFLVLGIKEKDDYATEIVDVRDAKKVRNQIYDILKSGVQPIIPGIDDRIIDISDDGNNKKVIVFDIPKSPLAPHQMNIRKIFYRRNKRSADPMNYIEVKETVMQTYSLHQEVSEFIEKMISKSRGRLSEDFIYLSITPITASLDRGVYSSTKSSVLSPLIRQYFKSFASYNLAPELEGYGIMQTNLWFFVTHGGHIHLSHSFEDLKYDIDLGKNRIAVAKDVLVGEILGLFAFWRSYQEKYPISSEYIVTLYMESGRELLILKRDRPTSIHNENEFSKWNDKILEITYVPTKDDLRSGKVAQHVLDRLWNAFGEPCCPWVLMAGNQND